MVSESELRLEVIEYALDLEGPPLSNYYKHIIINTMCGRVNCLWKPKKDWLGRLKP